MTDRSRNIESFNLPEEARSEVIETVEQFEAVADESSDLLALSHRAKACRDAAHLLSEHSEAIRILGPSLVDELERALDREHEAAADAVFKTGHEVSIQRYAALALSVGIDPPMVKQHLTTGEDNTRLTTVLRQTITDSQSDQARRMALQTLATLKPALDSTLPEGTSVRHLSNSLCQLLHEDLSNAELRSAVEVLTELSARTSANIPAKSVSDALQVAISNITVETNIKAIDSDGNRVEIDGPTESTLASWSDGEDESFVSEAFDDHDRALIEGLTPIVYSNLGLSRDKLPIDLPWLTPGTEPIDALGTFVRTTNPLERKKAAIVLGEIAALFPDDHRTPDSLVDRVQRYRGAENTQPARALGEIVAMPENEPNASVSAFAALLQEDRDAIGSGGEAVLGEVAAAMPEIFDWVPTTLVEHADMVGEARRDGPIRALGTVVATGANSLDAAVEQIVKRSQTCDMLDRIKLVQVLGEVFVAEPTCAPEVPSTLRERVQAIDESISRRIVGALGEVVATVTLDERGPIERLISLVRGTEDIFSLPDETTLALGEMVAADPAQVVGSPPQLVARVQRTEGNGHIRAAQALGDLIATDPKNADAAVASLIERVNRGEKSSGRNDHWRTALTLGEIILADPDRFDSYPDVLINRATATANLEQRRAVGALGEIVAAAEGTDRAVIDCFVKRAKMPKSESRRHVVHILGVALAVKSDNIETVPDLLMARVKQISADHWWWSAGVLGQIVSAHRRDMDQALEALIHRLRTAHGSTRMQCAQAIGELVATSPHRLNAQTAQFVSRAQAATGKQQFRWLRLTGRIHARGGSGAVRQLCRSLGMSDGAVQEECLKELVTLADSEGVTLECFLKNATVAIGDDVSESVDLTPYFSLEQKPLHQFLTVVDEFMFESSAKSQFLDIRIQLQTLLNSNGTVPPSTRLLVVNILSRLDEKGAQYS